MSACLSHFDNVTGCTPKSCAICSRVSPGPRSRATRITSSLNSLGYLPATVDILPGRTLVLAVLEVPYPFSRPIPHDRRRAIGLSLPQSDLRHGRSGEPISPDRRCPNSSWSDAFGHGSLVSHDRARQATRAGSAHPCPL